MRVGIFGGVFNPPHLGHLICAQEAHRQLALDVVVLVPVGEAPHRSVEHDPGGEMRFQLCERATVADDRLDASRLEVDRTGPSYTVETLRVLRERAPKDERVLVLGADQASRLADWRAPDEVLALAEIAVVDRGGVAREDVSRAVDRVAPGAGVAYFDMPRVDISSTLVRERVSAGASIRYLVPDPVAAFVEEHDLYRAAAPLAAE